MRILRDPTAEGGAADAARTEAKTTEAKAAETKAEAKAAEPAKIQVDPGEYSGLFRERESLRSRLAALESEKAQAVEAERNKHLQELAETKGAKAALEEQQKQLQEKYEAADKARRDIDARYLGEKKANAINDGLAGIDLIDSPAAQRQVRRLLDERFSVERDAAGKEVVRDRETGRYAADAIPDIMRSDEFAHFLKPTTTGGSGTAQKGGATQPFLEPNANLDDPQLGMLASLKRNYEARSGLGL